MSYGKVASVGATAALLLASSALAQAQIAPPVADRLVSETEATHIANMAATGGTAGTATAWFWADPQNNTLRWTIEFDRVDIVGADIMCRVGKVGPAPAGTPAAVVPVRSMTAAIEPVPVPGATATPAAAPGAGDNAANATREVLDLFEGVPPALDLQSPFEGEAANLDDPIFDEIQAGGCFLQIEIAAIGGAGGGG